ncbi:Uncharacterized protein Fot_08615 [Forsythia ovata]|uniref:Uncharacterized protein n=1 Tax=Forsythia ovata TaxID=205694 RepID=A0ABD1WZ50_9LAMI
MASKLITLPPRHLLYGRDVLQALSLSLRCGEWISKLTRGGVNWSQYSDMANDLTASIDISVLQERLTNMINLVLDNLLLQKLFTNIRSFTTKINQSSLAFLRVGNKVQSHS